MRARTALLGARRRARLSQRALAAKARVPYSTIARIETGSITPRIDTLDRLLQACGESLEVRPRRGMDEDKTLIQERLRRSPEQRMADLEAFVAGISALRKAFIARRAQ